jgi:hypothetical protein
MQPGWGRDASTAQGRSLRDRPCFAQHDSRAYGLARRAPRDAAAALDDFLEGGFGIHVPFPGVFESHDLGTGAGAVFFGEEDVVVLAAVEGRVEVDEVDGLVLDVLAEDGEVVAVIQLVLLHCRAILAGMLWGGNLIVGVVPAGSVPSYWAYLGLTSGAIIWRPYGAWVGSRRRAGSWALRPDGTGPPDSRGRLSLHVFARFRGSVVMESKSFGVGLRCSHLSQRTRKMGHPAYASREAAARWSWAAGQPRAAVATFFRARPAVGRVEVKILRCRLEGFPPFAKDAKDGAPAVLLAQAD